METTKKQQPKAVVSEDHVDKAEHLFNRAAAYHRSVTSADIADAIAEGELRALRRMEEMVEGWEYDDPNGLSISGVEFAHTIRDSIVGGISNAITKAEVA